MLKFYVYGQRLRMENAVVAADSIGYLTARFMFQTEDWDGVTKTAVFEHDGTSQVVMLHEDRIDAEDHLDLTAGEWAVHLVGMAQDGATVSQRITTTQVRFMVEGCGEHEGEALPELSPTYGEQVLAVALEARETAQSVRDDADAGAFNGLPGVVVSETEPTAENHPVWIDPNGETDDPVMSVNGVKPDENGNVDIETGEIGEEEIAAAVEGYLEAHPVEAPQADWSVNDPSDPAYVKGRTHWGTQEAQVLVRHWLATTAMGDDYWSGRSACFCDLPGSAKPSSTPYLLTDGSPMTVVYDGDTYTSEVRHRDYLPYVGNIHLLYTEAEDTGEPFALRWWYGDGASWGITLVTSVEGDHTIYCEVPGDIHPLDSKYIPDDVKPLTVNIDYDKSTDTYSADKTYLEIVAAHEAGRVVQAVLSENSLGSTTIPLTFIDPYMATFSITCEGITFYLDVSADNSVGLDEVPLEMEALVTSVNGKAGDVALTAKDVGAEPEIFYVSLGYGGNPGEGITNKTYSEIRSALDAGQRVIGYVGDVPAQLISCASINSSGEHTAKFLFIDTNSSQFYIFTVYDSRYCLVDLTATCKIIVVEVTQSDSGDLTANRSAHDIRWSVENEGHTVMLRRDETYYQLSGIRNNYVDFSAVLFDSDGAYLQKITIDYKRVVSVSESRASAGTLVVNFTTDGNEEGTADCTFSQVCETLDNGGAVVGYLNDVILQACVRTDDEITFYIPLNVLDASVAGATYIYLLSDDTVLTEARPITALPNPHKLTLTGAVKAEYDGSAAVSVEIPAGGGGDSSLGITGASVGQTVKITEVDDNGRPTAWEAVEMAGQWKLHATLTLEEDTPCWDIALPATWSRLYLKLYQGDKSICRNIESGDSATYCVTAASPGSVINPDAQSHYVYIQTSGGWCMVDRMGDSDFVSVFSRYVNSGNSGFSPATQASKRTSDGRPNFANMAIHHWRGSNDTTYCISEGTKIHIWYQV